MIRLVFSDGYNLYSYIFTSLSHSFRVSHSLGHYLLNPGGSGSDLSKGFIHGHQLGIDLQLVFGHLPRQDMITQETKQSGISPQGLLVTRMDAEKDVVSFEISVQSIEFGQLLGKVRRSVLRLFVFLGFKASPDPFVTESLILVHNHVLDVILIVVTTRLTMDAGQQTSCGNVLRQMVAMLLFAIIIRGDDKRMDFHPSHRTSYR
jgi:hypothetical protein